MSTIKLQQSLLIYSIVTVRQKLGQYLFKEVMVKKSFSYVRILCNMSHHEHATVNNKQYKDVLACLQQAKQEVYLNIL
jgi:hypothetical protein